MNPAITKPKPSQAGETMPIFDRPTFHESPAVLGSVIAGCLPQQVLQFAHEFFPGPVSVETEVDPEIPDQPFLVVTVHASGPLKDIVRRQCEWHANVEPYLGNLDVRLAIIPHE